MPNYMSKSWCLEAESFSLRLSTPRFRHLSPSLCYNQYDCYNSHLVPFGLFVILEVWIKNDKNRRFWFLVIFGQILVF